MAASSGGEGQGRSLSGLPNVREAQCSEWGLITWMETLSPQLSVLQLDQVTFLALSTSQDGDNACLNCP
jgi:hypothetical protein